MHGPSQSKTQSQSDAPTLLSEFPDATPEQRAILMLMSRVDAMESELLDARARMERAERTALSISAGVLAISVGTRVLWTHQCSAGIHPVPGRSFVALTDLASDLIDRALLRGRGPLFDHLEKHSDGAGRPESGALTEYVAASGLASGLASGPASGPGSMASMASMASVQFINMDAGMLMVHITGDRSMLDVMAALHRLLEEEDGCDSTDDIYSRHQLLFVFVTRAVAGLVSHLRGSTGREPVRVPPGGMEGAVSDYISTRPGMADEDRRALERVCWRPHDYGMGAGSTLTRASRVVRAS